MPPPDSPSGALSVNQKETIRNWIAAGAPAEPPAPEKDLAPPLQEANETPAPPFLWRALAWLGKFHLLLLHFWKSPKRANLDRQGSASGPIR